jgi:hypothetical protein
MKSRSFKVIAAAALITILAVAYITISNRNHNTAIATLLAELRTKYPQRIHAEHNTNNLKAYLGVEQTPLKIVVMSEIEPYDLERICSVIAPRILILTNTKINSECMENLKRNPALEILNLIEPVISTPVDFTDIRTLTSFQISSKETPIDLNLVRLGANVSQIQLHGFLFSNFTANEFWACKKLGELSFMFLNLSNQDLIGLLEHFRSRGISVDHLILTKSDVSLKSSDLQQYSDIVGLITF